ncbi:MAG: sensor histidine kinase [Bacteroidia bacterium]
MKSKRAIRIRNIQRLVFWTLSLAYFYFHFSSESFFNPLDFIYAALFLLLLAPTVVLMNNYYVPKYLNVDGKWHNYLGALLFMVIICRMGADFNAFFFNEFADNLLPDLYLINYYSNWELFSYQFIYTLIAVILHFSKGWFENIESQREISQLREVKLSSELKAIKSQINPHFLFNTLNSIYSLSLKNDPKTPDAIVNLSDLLRFSIYKTTEKSIPLSEEMQMVEKYLDLQLMRFKERLSISIDQEKVNYDLNIPPMLLMPLFENAFKHGDVGSDQFILAAIKTTGSHFEFSMSNAKKPKEEQEQKGEGGVGLSSIREQLSYYYGENHTFKVVDEERFNVYISILVFE